jgi:hypothetical protein
MYVCMYVCMYACMHACMHAILRMYEFQQMSTVSLNFKNKYFTVHPFLFQGDGFWWILISCVHKGYVVIKILEYGMYVF